MIRCGSETFTPKSHVFQRDRPTCFKILIRLFTAHASILGLRFQLHYLGCFTIIFYILITIKKNSDPIIAFLHVCHLVCGSCIIFGYVL